MPELVPAKHTGTVCGQMVAGSGPMSYRCELQQGHIPSGEPCYAKESVKSRMLWQNWKKAQPVPTHSHTYKVEEGNKVVCSNCGDTLPIVQSEPVEQSPAPESVDQAFSQSTGAQGRLAHAAQTGSAEAWVDPGTPVQEFPPATTTGQVGVTPPVVPTTADDELVYADDYLPAEPQRLPVREKLESVVIDSLIADDVSGQPTRAEIAEHIVNDVLLALVGEK